MADSLPVSFNLVSLMAPCVVFGLANQVPAWHFEHIQVPAAFHKFDWINLNDKGTAGKFGTTQLSELHNLTLVTRTFPKGNFRDLKDRNLDLLSADSSK